MSKKQWSTPQIHLIASNINTGINPGHYEGNGSTRVYFGPHRGQLMLYDPKGGAHYKANGSGVYVS